MTVPVPDLDAGLRYYGQALGHRLIWRNDAVGQAGLALPDGDSELVLTTHQSYEPNWLVDSVDEAVELLTGHGGDLVTAPFDIPVGRAAAVRDPFGNTLVLVDLSKVTYTTEPRAEQVARVEQPVRGSVRPVDQVVEDAVDARRAAAPQSFSTSRRPPVVLRTLPRGLRF